VLGNPLTELLGSLAKLVVAEPLHLRLQLVDLLHLRAQSGERSLIRVEYALDE
jgi:hypothetical protein